MKKYIIVLLFFTTFTASAQQELISDNLVKEELIRKMLHAQGSHITYELMIDNLIDTYIKMGMGNKDNLNNLRTKFKGEVASLLDILVPVYDKHFNEQQLTEIIEFYENGVGKVLVEKQPQIIKETTEASQSWAMKFGADITKELTKNLQANTGAIAAASVAVTDDECMAFKVGEFQLLFSDSTTHNVSRTEEMQIHTVNGKEDRYEVEWISPCKYKLIPLDNPDAITKVYRINKVKEHSYTSSSKNEKTGKYESFIFKKVTK